MQTINLNINLILGPLSAERALRCRQLLSGLQINLGTPVIIIVIIFVPGACLNQNQTHPNVSCRIDGSCS